MKLHIFTIFERLSLFLTSKSIFGSNSIDFHKAVQPAAFPVRRIANTKLCN